jgi:DNA-binding NtrC family response regulator
MILEESELITIDWLPRDLDKAELVAPNAGAFRLPDQGTDLERVEFSLVRQAMDRSSGNQTRAAELLGISRDQLRYRLKKISESQSEY